MTNDKVRKNKNGYWQFTDSNKYVHIHNAQKAYGKIPSGYEVHHINGDKNNNKASNLIVVNKKQHKVIEDVNRKRINKNIAYFILNGLAAFTLLMYTLQIGNQTVSIILTMLLIVTAASLPLIPDYKLRRVLFDLKILTKNKNKQS